MAILAASAFMGALTAAVATTGAERADSPIPRATVAVRAAGQEAALTAADQLPLGRRFADLFRTCGMSSIEHPSILGKGRPEALWAKLRSGDHVHAGFDEPLVNTSWRGHTLLATEIALPLDGAGQWGDPLSRHGEVVVAWVKCQGALVLDLLCAAPLRPLLRLDQARMCDQFGAAQAEATATCPGGRECVELEGHVGRGETWTRPFGPGLTLVLKPNEYGWEIIVQDDRGDENLARLTPPYSSVPNPRFVAGWHFRNADNTGPNDGSVNAPQRERGFVFSPEVGRSVHLTPTPEQVRELGRFGRGRLIIRSLKLGNLGVGRKAHIESMDFSLRIDWSAADASRGPR